MDIELTRLAIRTLTESEARKILDMSTTGRFVLWGKANMMFHRFDAKLVIIRTNVLGGDTTDVHGGWLYTKIDHLDKEWGEICQVARAYL